MLYTIALLLALLFALIIYIEVKKWFINKKLKNFESLKLPPFLGAATCLWGKSNDQIIDILLEYFDEVKTTPFYAWAGPVLMAGVADPNDVKILLTSDHCLDKPYFYAHLHCKTSLISSNSERWKRDRRALSPTFSTQHLRSYLPALNQKSRILVNQMDKHLNEPANLYRTVYIGIMDMITNTTFGLDMNLQSERGVFMFGLIKTIMNSIQYRIARIWLRWDFVYFLLSKVGRDEVVPLKEGNKIMDEIYVKKVQEFKENSKAIKFDCLPGVKDKCVKNFLEQCLLLEQQGIFNRGNVLDQMRLILIAGTDTSSMAVFGTLLMLAINQKHQELVVDELRSIFDTEDCDVTQAHLNDMKYTERAIKESMRLLPPTPFIARNTSSEVELSRGKIPKNTIIIINNMHMHRNPKIWGENVLEFDPDRFLPENVAKRSPYCYVPFSAGPRNCIAFKYAMISAKITIAHLLRRYKFTTDLRFHDIRLNTHLVTDVTNENPLRIEKRNF